MTYAATIADGWETIHTTRPLVEIARDHATSRVLSPVTRAYFDDLSVGETTGRVADALQRESAFFEAAASMSTRKGQSYARRVALGDLHRLHVAAVKGETIAPRGYTIGCPVGITVMPDGTVDVTVYLGEAGQGVADDDNGIDTDVAVADSATVAAAVEAGRVTVTYSQGA